MLGKSQVDLISVPVSDYVEVNFILFILIMFWQKYSKRNENTSKRKLSDDSDIGDELSMFFFFLFFFFF
jgi:hypothetical protein